MKFNFKSILPILLMFSCTSAWSMNSGPGGIPQPPRNEPSHVEIPPLQQLQILQQQLLQQQIRRAQQQALARLFFKTATTMAIGCALLDRNAPSEKHFKVACIFFSCTIGPIAILAAMSLTGRGFRRNYQPALGVNKSILLSFGPALVFTAMGLLNKVRGL